LGVVTGKQCGILLQDMHTAWQHYQKVRDAAMTDDVAALCKKKLKPFTKGQNNFMSIEF
jgi:hypothetical protein